MTAHTPDEAMERLRKNFYELWKVLMEVRADPSVVHDWRRAPKGSLEWRKARQHEQALMVFEVSINE
jgi:hypothetical protein